MAAELAGLFDLGLTVGDASQVGDDLRAPIADIVDEHQVIVALTAPGGQAPTAANSLVTGMRVVVELEAADLPAQQAGYEVLMSAARRVADMLRVMQPTTGLPGTAPVCRSITLAVDGQKTDHRFQWRHGYRPGVIVVWDQDKQPNASAVRRALTGELNDDWDLDIYIGQALHFVLYNPDANISLGVYLAALAAEIKMKRTLYRLTKPNQRDELERDIPIKKSYLKPVQSLYSSDADRFIGRSLKVDNKVLLGQLSELFELRNAFTHQGKPINRDRAHQLVLAARSAMAWADDDQYPNYPH